MSGSSFLIGIYILLLLLLLIIIIYQYITPPELHYFDKF